MSIAPITSSNIVKVYPFEVLLIADKRNGLINDSKVACDQVRSIDKKRLIKKLGNVNILERDKIKVALRFHFDL